MTESFIAPEKILAEFLPDLCVLNYNSVMLDFAFHTMWVVKIITSSNPEMEYTKFHPLIPPHKCCLCTKIWKNYYLSADWQTRKSNEKMLYSSCHVLLHSKFTTPRSAGLLPLWNVWYTCRNPVYTRLIRRWEYTLIVDRNICFCTTQYLCIAAFIFIHYGRSFTR